MQRRVLLTSSAVILAVLAGCAGSASVTTLAQAQAYMNAGVAALQAAAQQYLAGPPLPSAASAALVSNTVTALTTVKTALDAETVPANWQAGALQAIALMQQLEPLVAAYLGTAAPYVPLAIAVIQAFIASLPPPVAAPVVPPAALARKAAELKSH
jgi:hypothetical protein